ncbi:MAG TPA: site-specific integrase [Candidatus Acidoferrum sp.]|jgi:integrase
MKIAIVMRERRIDRAPGPQTLFKAHRPCGFTVGELLDRKLASYQKDGTATAAHLSQIKRAKEDFGKLNSDALTEEKFAAYIGRRKTAGAANATVNRVTDLVRSAYRDAGLPVPRCEHLSEKDNVRKGFFSPDDFYAVHVKLEDWLGDYVQFAYLTGWRAGSIRDLEWDAVDFREGEINLPGEFTKNGEPLAMPLEGELAELLARRKQLQKTGAVISTRVFDRDGQPITQSIYQRPWIAACLAAGQGCMVCRKCGEKSIKWSHCGRATKYSGRLIHDFRRTAARDLTRSGTPQSVAMAITGHKTDSMFKRYNIVDTDDVRKALRSMGAYRSAREKQVVAIQTAGKR